MPTESNNLSVSPGFVRRFILSLHRFEDLMLVVALSAMILLATLQIVLRNFFDSGLSWADPMLRGLVLWVGMLGALVAARSNKHIAIDVLSRVLSKKIKHVIAVISHLFVVAVTALIAWHSARMVWADHQDGINAFAAVPAWLVEIIIPIAFSVIALRYCLMVISVLIEISQKDKAA